MPEKKKSVVPCLRFPEFRDAGEWDEKPLGQVVRFLDGQRKPIKESDRAFMQGQYPYYGASGIIDYINDFIFDDDLILLGEDGENIVSRNLPLAFKVSGKCWVNNHAHVLKPNKPHHLNFLVQYLENLSYIKYNAGGAQPKLTQAICQKIPLLLPIPDEQQKIADCLSSLDEVIDLEAQKLEALKAHKKGLMQQLFPCEGETTPCLRFPEFRDAEEWDEKPLGQVVRFLDGQRKPIKESDRAFMQGQYPYYGASGIIDYINDFIFDDDLILLGEDGENIVSRNLPLAFKVSGKCWVNNHAHVLKPNKPHHLNFLVQYLENLSYIKYNAGGAQPKLTQAICQKIPLLLPIPDEQQKIAGCLSSLDEVIDLEVQKLEALKAHKKGLMQQLFPQEVD